jgi:hypothetical protein
MNEEITSTTHLLADAPKSYRPHEGLSQLSSFIDSSKGHPRPRDPSAIGSSLSTVVDATCSGGLSALDWGDVAEQSSQRTKTIKRASVLVDCTLGFNNQVSMAGIADFTNDEMPNHRNFFHLKISSISNGQAQLLGHKKCVEQKTKPGPRTKGAYGMYLKLGWR